MYIKSTLIPQLTLVRMAFIKKTTIISGRDISKRPLLRDAGENVISVAIISDFWYYNITPFFEYKSFSL